MVDYYRRIDTLLAQVGRKRPWLSEVTGIRLGTLNTWFSRRSEMGLGAAVLIARALEVSVEFLYSGEDKPACNLELKELCEKIKALSREAFLEVKGVVGYIASKGVIAQKKRAAS